eukprot:1256375-Amphidinium_carterae.1
MLGLYLWTFVPKSRSTELFEVLGACLNPNSVDQLPEAYPSLAQRKTETTCITTLHNCNNSKHARSVTHSVPKALRSFAASVNKTCTKHA